MSISQAQTPLSGWSRPRNQNLLGERRTKIYFNRSFHLHVLVKVVFNSLQIEFRGAEQSSRVKRCQIFLCSKCSERDKFKLMYAKTKIKSCQK